MLRPISYLLLLLCLTMSSFITAQASTPQEKAKERWLAPDELIAITFDIKQPTSNQYGVWLDDIRIENDVLENKQPKDFGWFGQSRLMKNTINYGKHTFQVNLYTKAYYDKYLAKKKKAE